MAVMDDKAGTRAISRSPEIMSGAAVFSGTRVPVKTLFDYLEAGDPLGDFLRDFPSVSRRQALQVLHEAETAIAGRA
jgi:uncharacterized protein (DUF433 family)